MCDNIFSILKEFRLALHVNEPSAQMLIEDPADVDMYFTIVVRELEGCGNRVEFNTRDEQHGEMTVYVKKDSNGCHSAEPIRVGTYGGRKGPGENTGLYVDFNMNASGPGPCDYVAFVQFKVKGGE